MFGIAAYKNLELETEVACSHLETVSETVGVVSEGNVCMALIFKGNSMYPQYPKTAVLSICCHNCIENSCCRVILWIEFLDSFCLPTSSTVRVRIG